MRVRTTHIHRQSSRDLYLSELGTSYFLFGNVTTSGIGGYARPAHFVALPSYRFKGAGVAASQCTSVREYMQDVLIAALSHGAQSRRLPA